MAITTHLRAAANRVLRSFNVRLETYTTELAEQRRLQKLERRDHFDRAVFPILPQFRDCDPAPIFEQIGRDAKRFAEITSAADGYSLRNDYCTTPDAEVLYSMVQKYRPSQIIEVGSGNSTKLFRIAITDAGSNSYLTSIDPHPRRDITPYADQVVANNVEELDSGAAFGRLRTNDFLFIDSSHQAAPGNDVNLLLLSVLPSLASGVLIHFHDIFLPYEYPRTVDRRWNWTEQYVLQALLTGSNSYRVLWPGHYLQRTYSGFADRFDNWRDSVARSLWLQRRSEDVTR